MVISEQDKRFLLTHVDGASELFEADSVSKVNELLCKIDDFIIGTMDKDGFPSKLGDEAQQVFDRIYSDN